MVQFINRAPEKPSTAERFNEAIGRGLESINKTQAQKMATLEIQKENEAAKRLGIDISGIKDPDLRKIIASESLKGKKPLNALEQAKLDALKSEEKLFTNIMGESEEIPEISDQSQFYKGISKLPKKNSEEKKFDLSNLSETKLDKLSAFAGQPGRKGIIGTMAKSEKERRLKGEEKLEKKEQTTRKQFEADREYHSKVSRPIIEAATEKLKNADINKSLRQQLKMDIASGNTSGFFPYMVDKLGLESFRNPESARFSNQIKNLFVGSLNEIPGARPNMFLERILSSAQPMIGRSPEANLTVMDIGDFVEDMRDEQAKQELEIAKEDRKNFGYVKDDVSERARERMGDFVNRRQEKMAMDIRKRREKEMDDQALISEIISGNIIPGTYVTPRTMKILMIKNDQDINKAIEDINKYGMKFPEYLD